MASYQFDNEAIFIAGIVPISRTKYIKTMVGILCPLKKKSADVYKPNVNH